MARWANDRQSSQPSFDEYAGDRLATTRHRYDGWYERPRTDVTSHLPPLGGVTERRHGDDAAAAAADLTRYRSEDDADLSLIHI